MRFLFGLQTIQFVSAVDNYYFEWMKFENVSILIERIYDLIKEMRYCWMDNDGVICEQRGVFRINCVDCLDRTNIVMTAIAKAVMDIQVTFFCLNYFQQQINFILISACPTWFTSPWRPTICQFEACFSIDVGPQWRHYFTTICWHGCFEKWLHAVRCKLLLLAMSKSTLLKFVAPDTPKISAATWSSGRQSWWEIA